MQLLNWIKSLFVVPSYQDSLEHFVASKRPSTPTEVEYWIRHYDQHTAKDWVL